MNRQLLIREPEAVKAAVSELMQTHRDAYPNPPDWLKRLVTDAYVLGIIDTVRGEKTGTAEYLRRNELVAKAIGAREALRSAITKSCFVKRFPQWCVTLMRDAHERMDAIVAALVSFRDLSRDARPDPDLHAHCHREREREARRRSEDGWAMENANAELQRYRERERDGW